jgi:hypothetical protein
MGTAQTTQMSGHLGLVSPTNPEQHSRPGRSETGHATRGELGDAGRQRRIVFIDTAADEQVAGHQGADPVGRPDDELNGDALWSFDRRCGARELHCVVIDRAEFQAQDVQRIVLIEPPGGL